MARDTNRQQMPFRLPEDQMDRLERAAKWCHQTKQAFVENAVREKLVEIEEQRRLQGKRVDDKDTAKRNSFDEPTGLGITEALRRQNEPPPVTEQASPDRGAVVVNVGAGAGGGSGGGGGGDAVERLATYVVTGPSYEKDARLRQAVTILHASATTEEERTTLADKLDKAINAKTKGPDTGGGVIRGARIAFKQLATLFTGDDE